MSVPKQRTPKSVPAAPARVTYDVEVQIMPGGGWVPRWTGFATPERAKEFRVGLREIPSFWNLNTQVTRVTREVIG